jgi:hypothetical protein
MKHLALFLLMIAAVTGFAGAPQQLTRDSDSKRVNFGFTVANGQNVGIDDTSYISFGSGNASYYPYFKMGSRLDGFQKWYLQGNTVGSTIEDILRVYFNPSQGFTQIDLPKQTRIIGGENNEIRGQWLVTGTSSSFHITGGASMGFSGEELYPSNTPIMNIFNSLISFQNDLYTNRLNGALSGWNFILDMSSDNSQLYVDGARFFINTPSGSQTFIGSGSTINSTLVNGGTFSTVTLNAPIVNGGTFSGVVISGTIQNREITGTLGYPLSRNEIGIDQANKQIYVGGTSGTNWQIPVGGQIKITGSTSPTPPDGWFASLTVGGSAVLATSNTMPLVKMTYPATIDYGGGFHTAAQRTYPLVNITHTYLNSGAGGSETVDLGLNSPIRDLINIVAGSSDYDGTYKSGAVAATAGSVNRLFNIVTGTGQGSIYAYNRNGGNVVNLINVTGGNMSNNSVEQFLDIQLGGAASSPYGIEGTGRGGDMVNVIHVKSGDGGVGSSTMDDSVGGGGGGVGKLIDAEAGQGGNTGYGNGYNGGGGGSISQAIFFRGGQGGANRTDIFYGTPNAGNGGNVTFVISGSSGAGSMPSQDNYSFISYDGYNGGNTGGFISNGGNAGQIPDANDGDGSYNIGTWGGVLFSGGQGGIVNVSGSLNGKGGSITLASDGRQDAPNVDFVSGTLPPTSSNLQRPAGSLALWSNSGTDALGNGRASNRSVTPAVLYLKTFNQGVSSGSGSYGNQIYTGQYQPDQYGWQAVTPRLVKSTVSGASPSITLDAGSATTFDIDATAASGTANLTFTNLNSGVRFSIYVQSGTAPISINFPAGTKQKGGGGALWVPAGANAFEEIQVHNIGDYGSPQLVIGTGAIIQ